MKVVSTLPPENLDVNYTISKMIEFDSTVLLKVYKISSKGCENRYVTNVLLEILTIW
jgi:hypothetical protein